MLTEPFLNRHDKVRESFLRKVLTKIRGIPIGLKRLGWRWCLFFFAHLCVSVAVPVQQTIAFSESSCRNNIVGEQCVCPLFVLIGVYLSALAVVVRSVRDALMGLDFSTMEKSMKKLERDLATETAALKKAVAAEANARRRADAAERAAREQADEAEADARRRADEAERVLRERADAIEANARQLADEAERAAREQADEAERAAREQADEAEATARADGDRRLQKESDAHNVHLEAHDVQLSAHDSQFDRFNSVQQANQLLSKIQADVAHIPWISAFLNTKSDVLFQPLFLQIQSMVHSGLIVANDLQPLEKLLRRDDIADTMLDSGVRFKVLLAFCIKVTHDTLDTREMLRLHFKDDVMDMFDDSLNAKLLYTLQSPEMSE